MKFDIDEIKKYIIENPDARIIIGGDSQRNSKKKKNKESKKWSRFVTCVIVYRKDKNKIFYEVSREIDIDSKPNKPYLRMMQETYKVADVTMQLMDVLVDREFECHLDINIKPEHGSSCALASAVGYVWGTIGIEPVVKPDSWAASCVADHIVKTNKAVLEYE